MPRLNIFVDETGDLGVNMGTSDLYGISFVFHEHDNDITIGLKNLNERLNRIGYNDMIHMAHLVMHHAVYALMDIDTRKSIFNAIYQFSIKIPINYRTIIIDKKYVDNILVLRKKIIYEINKMINDNEKYFTKFDKIVLYYDNGQEKLGNMLDSLFSRFEGYEHRVEFDHKEKRLFQVADMLTYLDKTFYKYKNNLKYNKAEKFFFDNYNSHKIERELNKKRL